VKNFLRSFVFAGRGIGVGAQGRNFRIMMAASVAVLGLAWRLELPVTQGAILVLCLVLVLSLELFNTAGEMLVDVLSPGHDERYGRIKDVLAGAVLVAAVGAVVVGLLIIGPRLLERL